MNFVRTSLNLLVKLQQMFRIAEIQLGMENMIGILLETGVGVQSAILHVCPLFVPFFVFCFVFCSVVGCLFCHALLAYMLACPCLLTPSPLNRIGGLVVKASASRAEDPRFESRLRRDVSGSSHTSDLKKIGTPVATLPGAWRYRISAGTGRPGVSIL